MKGYLFAIISALIYGCMPLMAKGVYAQGVNPMTLVLLRNLLALPVLALLALYENKTLKIPVRALPSLGTIAVTGGCLTPILLFASYLYMDSGTATVFHSIHPAVVVLVGMLFLKREKVTSNLISVAMCIAGIGLFYNPETTLDWRGCLPALASGVTYAVYILMMSQFSYKQISGYLFSFYIALISSIIMLAVCAASGQLTLPTTVVGWCRCGIFAVAITVGAVFLFQQSTFLIGGEKTSILSTLEPITGVVLGAVVFHEQVNAGVVIGSALVIGASLLIALSDVRKKENIYECR